MTVTDEAIETALDIVREECLRHEVFVCVECLTHALARRLATEPQIERAVLGALDDAVVDGAGERTMSFANRDARRFISNLTASSARRHHQLVVEDRNMADEEKTMGERIRLLVRDRKKTLVEQESRIAEALKDDPDRPLREREGNRLAVAIQIARLERILGVCRPYVDRLRAFVPKISDQTVEAACYLLFCEAVQHLAAVFILAASGLSFQASELTRSILEALDLIVVFLGEGAEHSNLKKWFDGEIIPNRVGRDSSHQFINEGRTDVLPVKRLKGGIYAALSSYNHMSYAAVLNSIDVYGRDFDWKRVAGFHYARVEGLPFAEEMLKALITTLKQFYRFHVGDEKSFSELDAIQTEHGLTAAAEET